MEMCDVRTKSKALFFFNVKAINPKAKALDDIGELIETSLLLNLSLHWNNGTVCIMT